YLGLESGEPYPDRGSQLDMTKQQRDHLRHRIPLLNYLEQHGWKPLAYGQSAEVYGKCPLHGESRPSFYVNRCKEVFYCHGCGQGGDLIRLAQLMHGRSFQETLQNLLLTAKGDLWEAACTFYQDRLDDHMEALHYLCRRGIGDPRIIIRM